MTRHAKGTFEVKMKPQAPEDNVGDPGISRMSLDKKFSGDLEGTSTGQMLAIGTEVEGSAGYVAIERVNGKLDDLNGTFALQHSGIMNRGSGHLVITVVPDSGTGDFIGLNGKLMIEIAEGKHFYDFEYALGRSN